MVKRDIIVIGASAGGVHALIDLMKRLPIDFGGGSEARLLMRLLKFPNGGK